MEKEHADNAGQSAELLVNDIHKKKSPRAVPMDDDIHKRLKKLADDNHKTMKEFQAAMVNFFWRTGIDPFDVRNENVGAAIRGLDKRFVSFIKTQEKELLNPILDGLTMVSKKQEEEALSADKYLKAILSRVHAVYEIMKNLKTEEPKKVEKPQA